jgi:hypothetical protein
MHPPLLSGVSHSIEIVVYVTSVTVGLFISEGEVQGVRDAIVEAGPSPLKFIAVT